jgi:secreted trypsin-like serine protease
VTVYGEDAQGYFNIELYRFKNSTPAHCTIEWYMGLKVEKTATTNAVAVAYGVPA